jgi:hypothetical protein
MVSGGKRPAKPPSATGSDRIKSSPGLSGVQMSSMAMLAGSVVAMAYLGWFFALGPMSGAAAKETPTTMRAEEIIRNRDLAREMFYHSYDNYMSHAFPRDELAPITCKVRWLRLRTRCLVVKLPIGTTQIACMVAACSTIAYGSELMLRRGVAGTRHAQLPRVHAHLLRRARHPRRPREPHRVPARRQLARRVSTPTPRVPAPAHTAG